jgi:hypothetical protein
MKTALKLISPSLLFVAALCLSLTVVSTSPALAQSDDDGLDIVMCAAVMPCSLDGEVLPEFRDGPCQDTYEAQCKIFSTKTYLRSDKERVSICRRSKRASEDRLTRKIRSLQRQLAEANRRAMQK